MKEVASASQAKMAFFVKRVIEVGLRSPHFNKTIF